MVKPRDNKGFSLIEAIVAIAVVVIGVGGALMITATSIKVGTLGSQEFIASNLAQEGIELTRSFRDKYWLEGMDYDAMAAKGYIPNLGAYKNYRVYLNADSAAPTMEVVDSSNPFDRRFAMRQVLRGYFRNMYTQNGGDQATPFYRSIKIERPDPSSGPASEGFMEGSIIVTSSVVWKTNVGDKSVVLQEALYDWK